MSRAEKTDMNDSPWLAVLARFGLVRGSFIPSQDLREPRLVSRYRRKLIAMRASEINRFHKILDDGGIKLGGVVADINGLSARVKVERVKQLLLIAASLTHHDDVLPSVHESRIANNPTFRGVFQRNRSRAAHHWHLHADQLSGRFSTPAAGVVR